MATTTTCDGPLCSAPIARAATGRPARFCSPNCRQAAHRERVRQAEAAEARRLALADARARARRARPLIADAHEDCRDWLAELAGSAADPGMDAPGVIAAAAELRRHVDRLERAGLAFKAALAGQAEHSAAMAAHE